MTELHAATGTLVQVLKGATFAFKAPDAIASDGTHVWVANFEGETVSGLPAQ